MNIDWKEISPEKFEKICFKLLEENKFKNLKWFGKSGGDKGRDLTAEKVEEPLPGCSEMKKWVIQCKRYTSKPPSKTDINKILVDAEEHNPNEVLIIVTNTLSSDTKDWIETKRKKTKYSIYVWEELDLEREISKHRKKFKDDFPLLSLPTNKISFYEINSNRYDFGFNEFSEIDIRVLNVKTKQEALENLKEFVEYIKNSDINFDIE